MYIYRKAIIIELKSHNPHFQNIPKVIKYVKSFFLVYNDFKPHTKAKHKVNVLHHPKKLSLHVLKSLQLECEMDGEN